MPSLLCPHPHKSAAGATGGSAAGTHHSEHTPALGLTHLVKGEPALVPAMARKWKQINRFVEILSAAVDEAGLAGTSVAFLDYLKEIPYFIQEVLPRLERMGLRAPAA